MNRIILASHGGMAAGVKDTVRMVLGDCGNLYTVSTTRDETESILVSTGRLLDDFAVSDSVYVVTDVLGGSVNQDMLSLVKDYPHITIICGMNLSLVLALVMAEKALSDDELEDLIRQAREQIINGTKLLRDGAMKEEEDDL